MRILFQGDSITDAGRDRDDPHCLGNGYASLAAELIREANPNESFEFVNRGISGHKAYQLLERWQEDAVDIKPDIISILVGINDSWHFSSVADCWMPHSYFEKCYREILTQTKEKTNAKIIMMEPYLLDNPGLERLRVDLGGKIQIVRKLAREFADVYIPLDGLFAAEAIYHEKNYFSADGVHPNAEGAKFIAKHYVEAYNKIISK